MEKKNYKVGDTFKPKKSRVEYTVVATFQDNEEEFVVAKKTMGYERHIFHLVSGQKPLKQMSLQRM